MKTLRLKSAAEQVAAHLREAVLRGEFQSLMPGLDTLTGALGVNRKTVHAALVLLEADGLLEPQGKGRRRRIVLPRGATPPALRVGLLSYEPADRYAYDLGSLPHRIMEAGHTVVSPPKTLTELGMDVRCVARMVQRTRADAWVVFSASNEVLRWFTEQPFPTMAFTGQIDWDMPIAAVGPTIQQNIIDLVRHLTSMGHRRIVLLTRSSGKPTYFTDALMAQRIRAGSYNAPHFDPDPAGFRHCLDALFTSTPPTALVIDETCLLYAVQNYLARRGLLVPAHISLVCINPDPLFAWSDPAITHFFWDADRLISHILRWVARVSRGQKDWKKTLIQARFAEGGTIGPPPGQ